MPRKRSRSAGIPELLHEQLRSAMRGAVPQSFACLADRGPDAPDRGADQKRQAADRRIGGKRHPSRSRQREGHTDHHHPDCRRQKYEPRKHFPQPPRDFYDQDARRAWQDYGRALVKVRRTRKALMRDAYAPIQENQSISALVYMQRAAQPKGDSPDPSDCCRRNLLNKRYILLCGDGRSNGVAPSVAKRRRVRCRIAAKWQNSGRPKCWIDRELHEECLSFVIPRQHGRTVSGQEDFK